MARYALYNTLGHCQQFTWGNLVRGFRAPLGKSLRARSCQRTHSEESLHAQSAMAKRHGMREQGQRGVGVSLALGNPIGPYLLSRKLHGVGQKTGVSR